MRGVFAIALREAFRKKMLEAKADIAWRKQIQKLAEEQAKRLAKIEHLYETAAARIGIKKTKRTFEMYNNQLNNSYVMSAKEARKYIHSV
jgi:hypothetical protein